MQFGAITQYIDVAQILLYAFWIFFVGLIIYLRREDKREGYPLQSDRSERTNRVQVQGFPRMPPPKTFRLAQGGEITVPRAETPQILAAAAVEPWPGAPLEPSGNPMLDGVGPAAFAERADAPDLTLEGEPRIAPLRIATDFAVEARDPDPRGRPVLGADGVQAGVVQDLWIDRSEPQIRYIEVATAEGRAVLVPIGLVRLDSWRRCVHVHAVLAGQFETAPTLAAPDRVTLREEDRICAYFAGGTLYAEPGRQEPWL